MVDGFGTMATLLHNQLSPFKIFWLSKENSVYIMPFVLDYLDPCHLFYFPKTPAEVER